MSGSDSARMYKQVTACAELVQKWGVGVARHARTCIVSARNQASSALVAAAWRHARWTRATSQSAAAVILLCSAAILGACDSQAQERGEARELLAKLNTISDERSLRERHAALDELSKLRLKTPALIAMRDACHAAHQGLLEAETAQTSARKALAAASASASAKTGDGTQLSQAQASTIAAEIEHSNRALAEARGRFPSCERAMRDLTTRAH